MKMLGKFALFALAMLLIAAPTAAQDAPWKHGDDEYAVDFKFTRSNTDGEWDSTLSGAWLHFATDRVQIGTAASFVRDEGEEGGGAGPAFEYNFPALRRGHFFVGGDAQALAGEMSALASLRAAARFGYKVHVGNSSAIRIAFDAKRPINEADEDAGDRLREVGLTVGFSLGVTPQTTVQ